MIELVVLLIKLFLVFNVIMGLASICTWIERKGSALIQDRIGANRAGAEIPVPQFSAVGLPIWGFIAKPAVAVINLTLRLAFIPLKVLGVLGVINTLVCDAVKAITKEDFVPEGTNKIVHALAPFMAVFPVFLAFAVIPLAPDFTVFDYKIRPVVAEVDAGVLFFLAMGSIAVYGVVFAGWCGNNKFALLGGLRATAQMISYELAMGLSIVAAVVTYGTFDLYEIVEKQNPVWGVFTQPLTALILFIVGMAETKRGPFDLPESESELVAGYFTEYSGMKFLVFWLGEFAEIGLFALIISIMFFGGWHFPGLDSIFEKGTWMAALLGHAILMGKVIFFSVLQIVLRWTLPRFRFDQLMNLGWKILLPISMVNLVIYSTLKLSGF